MRAGLPRFPAQTDPQFLRNPDNGGTSSLILFSVDDPRGSKNNPKQQQENQARLPRQRKKMAATLLLPLLALWLRYCVFQVAASTLSTFSDTQCQKSLQSLPGNNGYPDGLCTNFHQQASVQYSSFMIVQLDDGCSGTFFLFIYLNPPAPNPPFLQLDIWTSGRPLPSEGSIRVFFGVFFFSPLLISLTPCPSLAHRYSHPLRSQRYSGPLLRNGIGSRRRWRLLQHILGLLQRRPLHITESHPDHVGRGAYLIWWRLGK